MEGFEGKVLSELVEIASREYSNRDILGDRWTKKLVKIMVAVYWGTGLWHPRFMKEEQKPREVGAGRGSLKERETGIGKTVPPKD